MQTDFVTPRLSLSLLTLNEDEFILVLLNTPDWLRFIGDRNVRSVEDARAYINKIILNQLFKYWVVTLKNEQTPIGIITLIKRDYLEFPDIGFAFLPAYEHAGYAFEASSVILNYLAEECVVARVLAITVPGNTGSIRLLTKLGLDLEKETEADGEKLMVYGLSLSCQAS